MPELNFNAEGKKGLEEFQLLPDGEYSAMIEESEFVSTDEGRGTMLKAKLTILEGEYEGRNLFINLNLDHIDKLSDPKKKQMVEIAEKTLVSIMNAIGVMNIQYSEQLHTTPFNIKVGHRPDKKTGVVYNQVQAYYPYKSVAESFSDGTFAQAPVPQQQAAPPMQPQQRPPVQQPVQQPQPQYQQPAQPQQQVQRPPAPQQAPMQPQQPVQQAVPTTPVWDRPQ